MRVLIAALLAATATPALAASVHDYDALVVSPDGKTIATIEDAGSGHDTIVERAVADGHVVATLDPCAACDYSDLTFGPDGTLAFLARSDTSLTLQTARGNRDHTVATIAGIASTPRFSPDGKRIALLVTLGAQKQAGATQPGVRLVGEIGEHNDERRLAVFDVAGTVAADAVKPVSPAGRYIYEYDWTPDGKGFVVTSAVGNGDDNWWVATLDAIDATTGTVRQIAKPATQVNFPRVSPDGKTVAYIGGLMSDFGSVGGDVYTVPFTGGTPTDITSGSRITNTSLLWLPTGLTTTALAGDTMEVTRIGADRAQTALWKRQATLSAGDARVTFSADGRTMATVAQDFEHAPAIFAGPASAPRQITHDNDDIVPAVKAESVNWTNDGHQIQGWLLSPRTPSDPGAKVPMITVVHGGPAAASTPRFADEGTYVDLINAGYDIFLPNPRGSYGQGEAFVEANKRDFGGGDLRDILAGITAVEKQAPVDENRLGLMGGSYGGFMAMFANTQTNRFKALVAAAGLSNWISYYGTNGIDQWMLPFFGKTMYDDPDAYNKVSAVNYAKQAHTPTFIYVGERDIEVPPTQSIEWWHALKDMHVPVSLVIYPGEGHGLRDPDHRADAEKRTIAWFDKYLKP
ncbi:S9 family peptidase [Hephaestia mangrovi]|uniref:S9 family peptidase n=1 Tax=Hephaestia mangrovi TaxID=2873268 RepID=UPI001CA6713F|nr:S9 family peptidase [Hephaestia mangrovi]MBY8828101.1 S9 family peptidase [Hephaestia mangrovi]